MEDNNALRRPQSLGRALNFATAATNALCNDRLAEHGLTLPQWVVLSALWQKDALSVSEIADYTGNAGPATSRILDRMVDKDLIDRRQDPEDRRAARIFLTAKSEALRPLASFHRDVNAILLNGISAEEAEILFRLLDRAFENARGPDRHKRGT